MVPPFAPYALEYGEGFRKKRGLDLGSLPTMLVMPTTAGAGRDLLDRGLTAATTVLRGRRRAPAVKRIPSAACSCWRYSAW